ncbi:MAG: lytic transglycosylase domain-containing protein [Treponema sp.]|nr:lytic transglycosylase domain-containing protein [Candidatus Treponema equi]
MKIFRIVITTTCILLAFSSTGCAQNDSLQKKYGADASYFLALNAIKENNTQLAIRNLKDASKKGSPLVARRAMFKLAETGAVQERSRHCIDLLKKYNDEDSLLVYARENFIQKEYYAVISKTDGIDLKSCSNELAYCRLSSMFKKNDSRLKREYRIWLTERSYSSWHNKFYSENLSTEGSYSDSLAEFRNLVYAKSFTEATEKINAVLETKANRKPSVFSDVGKALLYGTKDFDSAASFMDSLTKTCPENCRFYCYFYAGRYYDKTGNIKKATENFIQAMEIAENEELYDNALWYVLNTKLKTSPTEAVDALEQYGENFHDRNYYDDFFDTLSVRIIGTQQWELYRRTAQLCDGRASPESCSKFSYVTARLIQAGYLRSEKSGEASDYLRKALVSGSDIYYKILAMEKLGFDDEELKNNLCRIGTRTEITVDQESENLLYGYADFGLTEYIYDEYMELKDKVSSECAKKMAAFLRQCGKDDEKYLTQSIRIASRRIFSYEADPDTELLALAFPRNYSTAVSASCALFSQPEYILYALIRSESFFNTTATSHAGAVGLTQLMDSTAGDIARKMKISEYDLTDSETNIKFGSFYLEELTRRLDGSIILAAFSYNGGISRVRSWIKSASLEFNTKKVPNDLFLEALPYTETREYGRKILSAAGMYGWLYYDKSTSEIAKEILSQ